MPESLLFWIFMRRFGLKPEETRALPNEVVDDFLTIMRYEAELTKK